MRAVVQPPHSNVRSTIFFWKDVRSRFTLLWWNTRTTCIQKKLSNNMYKTMKFFYCLCIYQAFTQYYFLRSISKEQFHVSLLKLSVRSDAFEFEISFWERNKGKVARCNNYKSFFTSQFFECDIISVVNSHSGLTLVAAVLWRRLESLAHKVNFHSPCLWGECTLLHHETDRKRWRRS